MKLSIGIRPGAIVLDKKDMRRTLRQAGAEVAAAARALMRKGGGGGKTYYRDGVRYQASAPGQAPGRVTGDLARSIKVRPFKSGDGVAIRDAAFYALFLEKGAKGGGRKRGKGARNRRGVPQTARLLEPRPFLTTALRQQERSVGPRLRAAILGGIAFKASRPKR